MSRSNVNSWWGAATAETLYRLGVRMVVVSPGSRSTPLTCACAQHTVLDCRVILDERSAGFFALGVARARHELVVLICTSGSAVANYFPAVLEAHESGVALLVLTADRPPELRHRHAGQTIDQLKLFGDAVRFFGEAPVPEARPEVLAAWRDLLSQSAHRALREGDAGPVHLNCPFRDPLTPAAQEDSTLPHLPSGFWPQANPPRTSRVARLSHGFPAAGWIVAGPASPRDRAAYAESVGRLSAHLGWPVFADALSPLRHHRIPGSPPVTTYDTFLRNPEIGERVKPGGVVQLGDLPTSKVLREALREWQLPTWVIDPAPDSRNAVFAPATPIPCRVEELVLEEHPVSGAPSSSLVIELDRQVREALDQALASSSSLIEPKVALVVIEATPEETPIFVASSMPVRDAEYFWPANGGRRRVFFNRGANGIDGTLSTALGMADALAAPSVLYTGDLALLHDTNGLLAASSAFRGGLTIVCVNNRGGGIFEHLPVAGHGELFETYFATPQAIDFASWCAAYGIEHLRVQSEDKLRDALGALPSRGVRLLEIATDRKTDAAWRKATFASIANGCSLR